MALTQMLRTMSARGAVRKPFALHARSSPHRRHARLGYRTIGVTWIAEVGDTTINGKAFTKSRWETGACTGLKRRYGAACA